MRAVSESRNRIVLSKEKPPLGFRIAFLVIGVPFFALGLFGCVQTVLALVDFALGRDFEGNFFLGLAIAIGFTVLGGMAVWSFFIPTEDIVFDGDAKAMTSTRHYPFGRIKTEAVQFSNLALPELVWIKDADSSDGGDWHLRITLPDGRRFDHKPLAHTTSGQQRAAETLRDNITALM